MVTDVENGFDNLLTLRTLGEFFFEEELGTIVGNLELLHQSIDILGAWIGAGGLSELRRVECVG